MPFAFFLCLLTHLYRVVINVYPTDLYWPYCADMVLRFDIWIKIAHTSPHRSEHPKPGHVPYCTDLHRAVLGSTVTENKKWAKNYLDMRCVSQTMVVLMHYQLDIFHDSLERSNLSVWKCTSQQSIGDCWCFRNWYNC